MQDPREHTVLGPIIDTTNNIHELRVVSLASELIYKKQQYLNIIINSSHTHWSNAKLVSA